MIDGIAVDHYQFFHYKTYFPSDSYEIYLHTSAPVTVGVLFAPTRNSSVVSRPTALHQCLYHQSAFGMWALEDEIIEFLSHSSKIHVEKDDITADSLFGANFKLYIYISSSILICLLLVYGLIDQFLIRKVLCHKKGESPGNEHGVPMERRNEI